MTNRNSTAFTVGMIAGLFGIYGLAHILNDKVAKGIVWFLFGGIIDIALASFAIATLGIGIVISVPVHIVVVYLVAKNGAALPEEDAS